MQVISLFSGIGGFELAAEWMGWENIVSCEINPFGQRVLKHYWPNAYHHDDVHTLTYTRINDELTKRKGANWRTDDIVLVGGFPCQPYSQAGKRLGKEDERHLWPEMLRIISEVKPTYIVGENVYGLVNWSDGLVFEEVCADLEGQGYEVQPVLLPAASIGAPHKRDRVWFVAYARCFAKRCKNKSEWASNNASRCSSLQNNTSKKYSYQQWPTPDTDQSGREERHDSGEPAHTKTDGARVDDRTQRFGNDGPTAYTDSASSQCRNKSSEERRKGQEERVKSLGCSSRAWSNFPTVSPVRHRDDGISNKLLRFVVNEFYDTDSYTSQKNRIQNLQEVWERIQSEKIWQQIRGLYSLESKTILFQTMQLYSAEYKQQEFISSFSEKLCEPIMQYLWKHKEFRCSPQGQELEKQRTKQFANSLSFLPHEVALAARRFETAISKFETWHRNESIKAAGNAIVPQVVYQIFKCLEAMK